MNGSMEFSWKLDKQKYSNSAESGFGLFLKKKKIYKVDKIVTELLNVVQTHYRILNMCIAV